MLDLRKPVAILFFILGSLLAGYGLAFPSTRAEIAPGFNVNLIWGAALIGFAALLLALSLRGTPRESLVDEPGKNTRRP